MSHRTYAGHGHVFRVDAPQPLDSRVSRALATLEVTGQPAVGDYTMRSSDDEWVLRWNDEEVGRRRTEDSVLLLLHWHVNQQTIASSVTSFTTLHAAVARSPEGVGVLLAAPMESGKTTTCTGLLRRGWAYLTDEAAAVTSDGRILAYPKPLTLDSGSWFLFPDLRPPDVGARAKSWLVPVTSVPADVVPEATLGLVVLPEYARAGDTVAEGLQPAQTALALAHSTFFFDQYGARDLRCVSALARSVPAYRLRIGALDAALDLIERLAAAEAAA